MTDWTNASTPITDAATLDAIAAILEAEEPVILEHRHYYGSRAPTRIIFEDARAFREHVARQTRPGDALYVWSYERACTSESAAFVGKVPDAKGRTPIGGA